MRTTSTRCSILVSAIAIAVATSAAAQSSAAIAEGLFREGKKLLDARKFSEACPKFEESARLDPSSGVELALGICYEGLGRTASAWGAYETAISLARRDNRKDRERAATERAAALEPRLAHATIAVPPAIAQLPGLVVKEDGTAIGPAAWSNAPIDPGSHALEVSATGKKTWQTTFTIDAGSSSKTIDVPRLEDEVVAPPAAPQQSPLRTIAIAGFAVTGATLVAASIMGGVAIANANDAKKKCPASPCADAAAVAENDTAGTLADWSTALFVVTGVLAAASLTIFFVQPSKPRAEAHLVVGQGFVGVGGTW